MANLTVFRNDNWHLHHKVNTLLRWQEGDCLFHPLSCLAFRSTIMNDEYGKDNQNQKILDWLSPLNPWQKHADVSKQRQPGTGQWLFNDPAFLDWAEGNREVIWCQGMRMSCSHLKLLCKRATDDIVSGNWHDCSCVGIPSG